MVLSRLEVKLSRGHLRSTTMDANVIQTRDSIPQTLMLCKKIFLDRFWWGFTQVPSIYVSNSRPNFSLKQICSLIIVWLHSSTRLIDMDLQNNVSRRKKYLCTIFNKFLLIMTFLYKKETLAQVFSCEFCEIFRTSLL